MTLISEAEKEKAYKVLNNHHRVFKYAAYVLGMLLGIFPGFISLIFIEELRDHLIKRKMFIQWRSQRDGI